MKNLFQAKLACGCLVGDGGMGTLLQSAGLPVGVCGELWNVEQAEKVVVLQRQYVDAGSDLLLTNTFGANPRKLSSYSLADRTEELNAAGARVARRATEDTQTLVVGDIGPSGAILEPFGDMEFNVLKEQFARQVKGLLDGGVDAFIIETMMDFGEVRCAFEAIRSLSDLPVIVSMFFDTDKQNPGQFRTMYGDTPAAICEKAESLGADVVGSNCGLSIDAYVDLATRFKEVTSKPIILQPNAGLGRPAENGTVIYDDPPERMATRVEDLFNNGATIVGGCCGTGPEYIRRVRRIADRRLGREN
ncbi:MAG TPA: homocysteine S-methyltransferase family protein [bacterium]|nr:homocysteine S-methyltransferase family protein [bacterium]HQL63144.1 homocysteine S-methyltransferase family protein [bacterium]